VQRACSLELRFDLRSTAGVVEHPLRVVRLHDRGLRGEQRRVETDRVAEIVDRDVNVNRFTT
jgi:hypothetical protein